MKTYKIVYNKGTQQNRTKYFKYPFIKENDSKSLLYLFEDLNIWMSDNIIYQDQILEITEEEN